jgi:hypothetical protein
VPLHWATGAELDECVFEQWISLEGGVVHARYQLSYRGGKTHKARHQEIPAIFLDPSLATLVSYTGAAPWTGAPLTRMSPGPTNEYFKMTENWVAYVDAKDFGVGAYVPAASEATCYRFRGGAGSDCSYVAPLTTFGLAPETRFSYEAYFALGPLAELRAEFDAIRKARERE